jgi:hypothetical protein
MAVAGCGRGVGCVRQWGVSKVDEVFDAAVASGRWRHDSGGGVKSKKKGARSEGLVAASDIKDRLRIEGGVVSSQYKLSVMRG